MTMSLPSGTTHFLPRPVRKLFPLRGWPNNAGVRVGRELGQRVKAPAGNAQSVFEGSYASLLLSHCLLGIRYGSPLQTIIRTLIQNFDHSNTGQWTRCVGHEFIRIMTGRAHLMSPTHGWWIPETRPSIPPLLISTDPMTVSPFTGKDIGAQAYTINCAVPNWIQVFKFHESQPNTLARDNIFQEGPEQRLFSPPYASPQQSIRITKERFANI